MEHDRDKRAVLEGSRRFRMSFSVVLLVAGGLLALSAPAWAGALHGQRASSVKSHSAAAGTSQGDAAWDGQPLQVFTGPPAGFDPTTATNASLEAYGFPPRPAGDALAQEGWLQAVEHAKVFEAPTPVLTTILHDGPLYTSNWAGHVAPNDDYSNDHFTWSTSTWTQPAVPGDSNYPNSNWQNAPVASFWVGTGANNLIQAGCDSVATATAQYRCWTEDFPDGTVYEGPVIHPGDVAYVFEQYLGNGTASYYLENETSGAVQSLVNPCPHVGYSAANFINERFLGMYLPNFGSASTRYNSFGTNGTSHTLNSAHNHKTFMTSNGSSSGRILSEPGSVDNTYGNFTQHWYAKQ